MKRALAHRVVYRGKEYRLSVVDISDGSVRIEPFREETPATAFVNGTLEVLEAPDGSLSLRPRP
ncbi:MAG: hypothetical protein K2F77_03470 [Muribaculaceae bacterium]|nr:hypothetical protein [Muribaculaceae bacterium]